MATEIKLTDILSCSCEEEGFPAENLLKTGSAGGKWQCKPGEKSASVIFRLERSSKIGQIDIGNNGSAFVEVLVGRSVDGPSPAFQVIIPASSFMSPIESRSPTTPTSATRVRIFAYDKLEKQLAGEKWDLVKVVCTQQFNKTLPYGISFIKIHTTDNKSGDNEEQKSVSVVNVRKSNELPPPKKEVPGSPKKVAVVVPRKETDNGDIKNLSASPKRPVDTSMKVAESAPNKLSKKDEAQSNNVQRKPLSGVVFVISGYQNPERGKLRSMGIALGARYEPDWDSGCTHLICAFTNTPKYNQVKGKGKIVKKQWLEDCFKQKARLDWKNYDMTAEEEEEEDVDNDASNDDDTSSSSKNKNDGKTKNADADENDDGFIQLPDIFDSKSFFLDKSALNDDDDANRLKKVIVALGGKLTDRMTSSTHYVIGEDGIDVEAIHDEHPEILVLRPDWVFACQRKGSLVRTEQFSLD